MGTPVLIRIRLLMSFHERLLCFVTYSYSAGKIPANEGAFCLLGLGLCLSFLEWVVCVWNSSLFARFLSTKIKEQQQDLFKRSLGFKSGFS